MCLELGPAPALHSSAVKPVVLLVSPCSLCNLLADCWCLPPTFPVGIFLQYTAVTSLAVLGIQERILSSLTISAASAIKGAHSAKRISTAFSSRVRTREAVVAGEGSIVNPLRATVDAVGGPAH